MNRPQFHPVSRMITGTLFAIGVLVLAGCPLPFDYAPSGQVGGSSASPDPSNPAVTGAPSLSIVSIDSAVTTTDRTPPHNVSVSLQTETRGAVIYYTVSDDPAAEPADPFPGDANTRIFNPDSPILLTGHLQSARIKAIAIGTNMYPSLTVDDAVTVTYEPVATPQFSPAPGNFASDQSVSISTSTENAQIYYTMIDGTGAAPTPVPGQAGTTLYTGPISVAGTGSAKSIAAIAVKDQMLPSAEAQAVYTIGYAGMSDPVVTPNGGTFATSPQAATITVATTGATLWYTTDGSIPTVGGGGTTLNGTSPVNLSLDQTTQVNVIASAPQKLNSNVVGAMFEFVTSPPSFAQAGGTYPNPFTTTISSATSGSTIWFTTDGSAPQVGGGGSTQSALSPASLTVDQNLTVRAVASRPGWTDSPSAAAVYTLASGDPTYSVPSGSYSDGFALTLSSATSGSVIHYTTDGTTPTAASAVYTGPIQVIQSQVVRAIAVTPGFADSAVTSAAYTLNSTYHTTSETNIASFVSRMSSFPYPTPPADPFPVGTTFVYQTNLGNLGKLRVKVVSSNFHFEYYTYGTAAGNSIQQITSSGNSFDLDTDTNYGPPQGYTEFSWNWTTFAPNYLFAPDGGIFFRLSYEFTDIDRTEIVNLSAGLSGAQIDNSNGNRIPVGAIIIYETDEGRFGKLVVTTSDSTANNGLIFDYVTYASDGTVFASGTGTTVSGTWLFDFDVDNGVQGLVGDMQLVNQSGTVRYLNPSAPARFWLVGVDDTP